MYPAYINEIATAVPAFDVHPPFLAFANRILTDSRKRTILNKSIRRAQIDHRYSFLPPTCFENGGFYSPGRFPDTDARMRFFEQHAIKLATAALTQLDLDRIRNKVTHLIVACCTGFYAPGLDIDVVTRFGLSPSVERTVIGFMGCYAGISALKLARHVVRSEPEATVLVVNIELCTLHLQEVDNLEQMLCFSLWGDGCAASLVSAEARGIELKTFHSTTIEDSAEQMTWRIGGSGFDIVLSGHVPRTLASALSPKIDAILGGRRNDEIDLWAVHPGGRSILDAIASTLELVGDALDVSRDILRRFGNMSSATIIFVLKTLLDRRLRGLGCAMAFGPGLTAESMIFEAIG
jgi:predicted naringenin-chalcone synthase